MTDLSICMVSFNCWNVLGDCLRSIAGSAPGTTYEIILVDNASSDGTLEKVAAEFPDVKLIRNTANVGFTRATNQAIESSRGRYVLWLNTDTVLGPNSVRVLMTFLETHPSAGIVGPKVLNADGSFQPQCRRGMPTPLAALYYLLKLDRLWPRSPRFGQYLLTHLPVDSPTQAASVSGCCLLARRAVWEAIGALDEDIVGFGEDIDWCVRAKQAGWQVWYYPPSVITHLKGQGGVHSKPYNKVWSLHQAMWVFYRKQLRHRYSWPVTAAVGLGVVVHASAAILGVWLQVTRNRCFPSAGRRPADKRVAPEAGSP